MDTNGKLVFEARKHRREASAFLEKLPDFDSALAGYAKRISEIAEVARRRGVRPVFLTQPSLWRGDLSQEERDLLWMGGPPFDRLEEGGYYSVDSLAEGMAGYNETLLRVCREQELDCLDTASSLPRDTRIFWDDLHVTEEGARVLAKLVAEFLLTREPLATMRERAAGTR